MTKYNRVTGKVFGATASATGDNPEIGQFGSAKDGSYIGTSDISTIQALPAWGQGWAGAVTPETNFPPLPEMTGAMKVLSQQQCYLLQQGLAEWDSATIYYTNNFSAKNGKIYISLTNENQGNDPETDKVNWKEFSAGGGLELCDIGMALYVDETKGLRRYLNGQIVDINTNTQAFLNRLLEIKNTNPELFTTESNWQSEALLNIDGCVYKFVLNYSGDNVVSVRLPKYPNYVEINAGGTLPVVGNGISLGLTDGTSNYGLQNRGTNHVCISNDSYGNAVSNVNEGIANTGNSNLGVTTDPTKSGIQTTLKQTKLKMRYFIQIATGSETENNIINDIELNNPYSLFDSKYSDHELNNLSWLKSEGQWNSKAVYPDAYDKLLKVYNGTETVVGLSVKLSTETYTDYDFVLNTADETFRLPLKNHTADDSIEGLTLYFYVGETVQNANLIDAGRIGEQLANKQDKLSRYPIEISDKSLMPSWYVVYSDGWCEQGGRTASNVLAPKTVTFLKSFKDLNYNSSAGISGTGSNNGNSYPIITLHKTTTSMVIENYMSETGANNYYEWEAKGYIA